LLHAAAWYEEIQVSSVSSNMAGVARRARLMTVSVATAAARIITILEMQYLHPPTSNIIMGRVCVMCMCTYKGVHGGSIDD